MFVHAPAKHRCEKVEVDNDVNVHAPAKHRREEVEVDNDVNVHAPAKHHHEEGPKAGSSRGAK